MTEVDYERTPSVDFDINSLPSTDEKNKENLSLSSSTIDLQEQYQNTAVNQLQILQLFDQSIHSFHNIQNLSRCYNLIHLNLHSNHLSRIQMLDSLTNLKILNLSSNRIERIEGLSELRNLEELNLSSNRITEIPKNSLHSQQNLRKLVLSYNFIEDIIGLSGKYFQSQKAKKLRYLDIRCNRIANIEQMEHLRHLSSLKHLIVEDKYCSKSVEPLTNKQIIADILPQIQWLNNEPFDSQTFASKIKVNIDIASPIKPKPKQKQKRSKPKQSTKATKGSQTEEMQSNEQMLGITPRIDAVLNRFYQRNGTPIPKQITKQKQETSVQTMSDCPNQRIDFLVDRLQKLFPNTPNKEKEEKEKEKEKERLQTIERGMQTTQLQTPNNPKPIQLSQDITDDFHINFGLRTDTFEDKEKQINELQLKNTALESQIYSLQRDLSENMSKTQCAIQKLEFQMEIASNFKAEKEALTQQLSLSQHRLHSLQQQMSDIKQCNKEIDEQSKRSNKLQNERINELLSSRNQIEQQLTLSKQSNEMLQTQITNLQQTKQNIETDKKLWNETIENLRKESDLLRYKLNENQTNYEQTIKYKDSENLSHKMEIKQLKQKMAEVVSKNDANIELLQQQKQKSLSDVSDLKTLLKNSLQTERKQKKTILELNDVVAKQNAHILSYKNDVQHLNEESNALRLRYTELAKKYETNQVIKSTIQEKLTSNQQTLAQLQQTNEHLRRQIDSLKSQLQTERGTVKELETNCDEKQQEILTLNDTIKVKTLMLNDQNETIATLKKQSSSMRFEIDAHAEKEKKLLSEMEQLKESYSLIQTDLERYSEHKHELESYKNKSEEYEDLYLSLKEKLGKKEEALQYVSEEVQQMKEMWQREKESANKKFETEIERKERKIMEMQSEITTNSQQLKAMENKLSSEQALRQKWEKECAEVKSAKVETEQEMRLILTEMERYKKIASQFAKAFNV